MASGRLVVMAVVLVAVVAAAATPAAALGEQGVDKGGKGREKGKGDYGGKKGTAQA